MASFQIHQDANVDKENPVMGGAMPIKEKTMTLGLSAKQPLAVIGGTGVGGPIGLKEKALAQRTNFGILNNGNNNSNNNGNQQHQRAALAGQKTLRVVGGNLKAKDENNGNNIGGGVFVNQKKSSSSVPVEQFKQFNVYEDDLIMKSVVATAAKTHILTSSSLSSTTTSSTTTTSLSAAAALLNKENVFQFQREHFDTKFENLHKNFHLDGFVDGTPMSVTDVLSPMSIDNSHLNVSLTKLTEENSSTTETSAVAAVKSPPRNDRETFFEVVEYQHSILEYFREGEKKHRPKSQYMRRQSDINHSMRTILVDWLVEVSEEYNLDTETLYLAVSYIDRFLSQMSVVRSKLQLVGTAAMYIASKYEEIYPPDVGEFVFITDDTYTKAQVLRMEQIILKILAFDLCTPTAYVFINTYSVLVDMSDKIKYLTLYISELALLDADPYLRFLPSQISSGSLAVARYTLGETIWTSELEEITTYKLSDIKDIVLCLSKTHANAATLAQQAIKDKYIKEKLKQVSEIEALPLSEQHFDELLLEYNRSATENKQNIEENMGNSCGDGGSGNGSSSSTAKNLAKFF